MDNLLEVKNLSLSFFENGSEQKILNHISFSIGKKEIVGIVGESGSGKSMTALSTMRLLSENAVITGGEILFEGRNIRRKWTAIPARWSFTGRLSMMW